MKDHRTLRVAIVGVSVEVMLASPVLTDAAAVQHVGPAAMRARDASMIRGMLQRLEAEPGCTAVPLCWATALPGGLMTADTYGAIKARTLDLIRTQGPFDGILVANHGALEAEGLDQDGDTDFVMAVRACVGPAVPIGVALDLHGDMTPALLAAATIFSVLRTAPHRDHKETGVRAAHQLLRVIRDKLVPAKAAVSIPILVPGETAVTGNRPAQDLYGLLPGYDARPGIMEANILVGFAWNDRPWTGVTALVVSDGDGAVAHEAALDLAQAIWDERGEFRLRMETAEVAEGLQRAAACPERPVYVSDAGDNTTAGAAGDLTLMLQAALDQPGLDDMVIAGITAPATVAALLAAGTGAWATVTLGAEHLSRPRTDRTTSVLVEACGPSLDLGDAQAYRRLESAWARVRIGGIVATFHARPIGITSPHHLRAMGIDPVSHKAYVVKLGYLHPELEDIAARHILLLSDGTSQLDMTRLSWSRLPRPIHPLDDDIDWSPEQGAYGDR